MQTALNEATTLEYWNTQLPTLARHLLEGRNTLYDVDDLVQIGLLEILKVIRLRDIPNNGYLYGVARLAMIKVLHIDVRALSLEAYCTDDETGDTWEMPESAALYRQLRISKQLRHRVFTLLSSVNQRQRLALRARFRISDKEGKCPSVESVMHILHLTDKSQYQAACSRGMQRLRQVYALKAL